MKLDNELRARIRKARSDHVAAQRWENTPTPTKLTDYRILLALANLTMDQREVWVDRNLIGRTLDAIGKSMVNTKHSEGISREAVRQHEKAASRAIYKYLHEHNLMEGLIADHVDIPDPVLEEYRLRHHWPAEAA